MTYQIRRATIADMEIIIRQRRSMFEEMGTGTTESLDRMIAAYYPWLSEKLETGGYVGFLAVDGDTVIAGAGAIISDMRQPHPVLRDGKTAHVVNVYTESDYRKQGLARRLMQTLVEYFREEGIGSATLHASQFGRSLYESLGFEDAPEMILDLNKL
jgi:GNAT superfamily N-acetyltransferase